MRQAARGTLIFLGGLAAVLLGTAVGPQVMGLVYQWIGQPNFSVFPDFPNSRDWANFVLLAVALACCLGGFWRLWRFRRTRSLSFITEDLARLSVAHILCFVVASLVFGIGLSMMIETSAELVARLVIPRTIER
jgi:hypothetical protein